MMKKLALAALAAFAVSSAYANDPHMTPEKKDERAAKEEACKTDNKGNQDKIDECIKNVDAHVKAEAKAEAKKEKK